MISWPSNTKNIIDQIRGAIGRDITFYIVDTETVCPECDIDPVTNTSTNSFCTTCSGLGYIYTYSGVTVSGHITWGFSEMLNWQTGGRLYDGDCRVQIEYTEANLSAVDNCRWVEVDGKIMQVIKKILRGFKEINRILIDLKEKERE